jgi:hypothetical protein
MLLPLFNPLAPRPRVHTALYRRTYPVDSISYYAIDSPGICALVNLDTGSVPCWPHTQTRSRPGCLFELLSSLMV